MAPDDTTGTNRPGNGNRGDERGVRIALTAAGRVAILGLVPVGVAVWLVSRTPQGRQLFEEYQWWTIGVIVAGVVLPAVLAMIPAIRLWIKGAPGQRRAAWMIFFVLPVVVGLVVAVVFLEPKYQMLAVRVVYLLIVCLLPGILFFLFIATRKWSLLSEFLTNMDRLGFYGPGSSEPDDLELARRRRVDAYLQKFEALYGMLDPDVREDALKPPRLRDVSRPRGRIPIGIVNLFTSEAAVPVVLATVVIAVIWLLVLPPWQGEPPVPLDVIAKGAPGRTHIGTVSEIVPWRDALVPNLTAVTAAFLGAALRDPAFRFVAGFDAFLFFTAIARSSCQVVQRIGSIELLKWRA